MTAIYRRELRSYFQGMTAYVFIAFLLVFAGIYTMVYNLDAGYPNFEYVLQAMTIIFLIAIPILTMRVIAEERRQKTDQLLYALPLGMTRVVLGKYLAMLTVVAIPCVIMGLYPPAAVQLRQRISPHRLRDSGGLLPAVRRPGCHRAVYLLPDGESGGGRRLVLRRNAAALLHV